MVGPAGIGKSVYINRYLFRDLPEDSWMPIFITFSARTSANMTQEQVDGHLDKRGKGVFGPRIGKKCLIFVDDLNRAGKETYGAKPPVEILRQHLCMSLVIQCYVQQKCVPSIHQATTDVHQSTDYCWQTESCQVKGLHHTLPALWSIEYTMAKNLMHDNDPFAVDVCTQGNVEWVSILNLAESFVGTIISENWVPEGISNFEILSVHDSQWQDVLLNTKS